MARAYQLPATAGSKPDVGYTPPAVISLGLLVLVVLLLPFGIRAATKPREKRHGVRWRGIQWDKGERPWEGILAEALAKHRAGDLPGALAAYDRALELGRSATVLNNRACALLESGDTSRAVADLREAILLEPANATAHCTLAEALCREGELALALASLERAAAIDPSWRAYAKKAEGFAPLRASPEGRAFIDEE